MKLLRLLFGKCCILCGTTMDPREKSEICRECLALMEENHVFISANETKGHVSLYAFADPIRIGLHRFKYQGKKAFGRFAGKKMAERVRQRGDRADIITCVPRAKDGLARMYNQSEVLAKVMAKELRLPFAPDLLKKKRGFPSQTHCSTPLMREENAKKAYYTNPSAQNIQGLRVLLVDDLYTTGATARACSELLKNQGAAEVLVYTAISHRAEFITPLAANFDRGHIHAEFDTPAPYQNRRFRNKKGNLLEKLRKFLRKLK